MPAEPGCRALIPWQSISQIRSSQRSGLAAASLWTLTRLANTRPRRSGPEPGPGSFGDVPAARPSQPRGVSLIAGERATSGFSSPAVHCRRLVAPAGGGGAPPCSPPSRPSAGRAGGSTSGRIVSRGRPRTAARLADGGHLQRGSPAPVEVPPRLVDRDGIGQRRARRDRAHRPSGAHLGGPHLEAMLLVAVWVPLLLVAMVFAHELGHLVADLLLDFEVLAVRLGPFRLVRARPIRRLKLDRRGLGGPSWVGDTPAQGTGSSTHPPRGHDRGRPTGRAAPGNGHADPRPAPAGSALGPRRSGRGRHLCHRSAPQPRQLASPFLERRSLAGMLAAEAGTSSPAPGRGGGATSVGSSSPTMLSSIGAWPPRPAGWRDAPTS